MEQFIYEVTVSLPKHVETSVTEYMLDKHIGEVLKHKAFDHAAFYRVWDQAASTFSFTVHYVVGNAEAFGDYQAGYGNEMKADFAKRFGQYDPVVTRRLLIMPERIDSA